VAALVGAAVAVSLGVRRRVQREVLHDADSPRFVGL